MIAFNGFESKMNQYIDKMKFKSLIFLSFCTVISSGCLSQNQDTSIIGHWQEIEYHGNNGAKDYIQKIENGRVLIFESNQLLKDAVGNKGTYQLKGDSLYTLLGKTEAYYRVYFETNKVKKLALTPVTNKYQFVCDEGCASIFLRIDQ